MHDLKGHLSKVLPDLTKVIRNTTLKTEIAHYLMDFFKKPNLYGSDFREAAIQILHIFAKSGLDQGDPLFVFIATIVKISEIVYSRENKRTPRQCLQFYNCAFLHQELYHDLFAPEKMSIYCHALLFHGPVQHEFVCSQSINTEGEERLFKQANSAAQNTDHKVENLAVALLTRIQCKQKVSETNSYDLTSSAQSRIQKAAEGLPTYSGSLFMKGFIKSRISRFQTHLQRISHFLLPGKDIWWDKDDMGNVIFKDGNNDLESHTEGPNVLHFRNTSYSDINKRAQESWMEIQRYQITIPLDAIRNNEEGQLTVHIQGQPIDCTLTCDEGILDSDSKMEGSEHCQVSLSDSSNIDLPPFTPTLVSTPKRHDRVYTSHEITEDHTSKNDNTQLNLEFNDSSVTNTSTEASELKTKLARVVAKVIGNSPDLVKFDEVRHLAKQCQTQSMTEAHKQMVKVLRRNVMKRIKQIKNQMKDLEKCGNYTMNTKYEQLQKESQFAMKVFASLNCQ